MELIRNEMNLPILERPIDRTETTICDEFFMTGTAAQVVAVTKVDHRPVGTGAMGPVVSKVRDLFEEIVRGRNEKYSQWITAI
jgi:branched-chain amino acid aminotransferase